MTAPRAYKITWASQDVGGTYGNSVLILHDVHRLRKRADSFELVFRFAIVSSDQDHSNFDDDCSGIEDLFRLRFQDLVVALLDPSDGSTLGTPLNLSHSSNTGLDTRSEIHKPGDDADTALSRIYEVTITGDLPPPSGQSANGLQELDFTLETTAGGIQTLTVEASYNANGGTQARSQAETRVLVDGASITSALGGTWEAGEQVTRVDRPDQTARISQAWRKKFFNDLAGTLDDSRIKNAKLSVSRSKEGSEGDADERKLATIVATYEAEIVTSTTDLQALYENTIRAWIIANMQAVKPGTYFALVRDDFRPDFTANRIEATLVALASSGGGLLELRRSESLDEDHGHIFLDVWDEDDPVDGEPTPAYVFNGPKTLLFSESVTKVYIGKGQGLALASAGGGGGPLGIFGIGGPKAILDFLGPEGGANVDRVGASGGPAGTPAQTRGVKVRTTKGMSPGVRGLPPYQFDVTEETVQRVTRYVKGVPGAAGGGGEQGGGLPVQPRTRERS